MMTCVCVEVLKLLAKICLRLVIRLFNNVHESVQWPKDFTGVREESKSYKIQRPSHSYPKTLAN